MPYQRAIIQFVFHLKVVFIFITIMFEVIILIYGWSLILYFYDQEQSTRFVVLFVSIIIIVNLYEL
jgi:hypothetical protein